MSLSTKQLSISQPAISVIVITLNEAKRIGNLLQDLSAQRYRNFEVILVDSNSDDNTCTIAQTFIDKLPKLTVYVMPKRGVSLGRNTGASLASHERLLFLDADVRLDSDFLVKAVEQLNQKPADVAGVYMNAQGLPLHYRLGYKLFNTGIFMTQFFSPTAVGACIFSTRHAHQLLHGFDETIKLCEDCDYVNRAKKLATFRMLPISFRFDPRRLQQDGFVKTGIKYLHANLYRFFIGELRNDKIRYDFGHYKNL